MRLWEDHQSLIYHRVRFISVFLFGIVQYLFVLDLNNPNSLWDEESWQELPNNTGPYIIPVELPTPNLYVPYNQEIPDATSGISSQIFIYQQILSPQKYEICKKCFSFIYQTNCSCIENLKEVEDSLKKNRNSIAKVKSSSFEFYDVKNHLYDDLESHPLYRSKSDVFDGNVIADDIRMGYLSQAQVE